jgi:hypothetical protein
MEIRKVIFTVDFIFLDEVFEAWGILQQWIED